MATQRTLKLNLLADVDKFGKGLDQAGKDAQGFGGKVSKYGKIAAGAFAAVGAAAGAMAIKIGIDSVKAAAEDEISQVKLAKALQNVTDATDANIAATEKWITEKQFATGVSDSVIRKGLERLVRSTKDVTEAQKLSTLALDIAAATGKDYETVANGLAKANDGNVNALKKLGITLGDNAQNVQEYNKAQEKLAKLNMELEAAFQESGSASEDYVKAQEKVAEQQEIVNTLGAAGIDWVGELSKEFSGSAAAASKTFAGQLQILKERFGELQEDVGAKFIPVLTQLLGTVMQVAKAFSGEDPEGLSARARELQGEMGDTGAGSLGRSIKILADSFANLFSELGGSNAKNANSTLQQMADALITIANAINAVASAFENYKKFYDKVPKGLRDFMNPLTRLTSYAEFFGGQRAAGGSVSAGQAYRVGEFGSEIFVPNGSGSIRPDNGGGAGNTFIFNGVIDGESARRSIERLLQDSARRTGAVSLVGATL